MRSGLPEYRDTDRLIRRRLLAALALIPLSHALGCSRGARSQGGGAIVEATIADRAAAARLGAAYLVTHPHEADMEGLWRRIQAAGRAMVPEELPGSDAGRLRWFQRLMRAEYAYGEGVLVEGWLLSASEARLYAMAALGAD